LASDSQHLEEVIQIPKIRSARKQLRQSVKRRGANRARKAAVRRVTKEIRVHLATGDKAEASSLLPQLAKAADKAAQRHAIHKNKASRIKSRWMKKVKSA
jgi:small subunit ribosomal protein S20